MIIYIDSNRLKFIHSENLDNGTLNRIISDLGELYGKLQSFFKVPEVSIPVFIFPDQETFHLFQYGKMGPKIYVGSGRYGEVKTIDPNFAEKLSKTPAFLTYNFLMQVVSHELVHVFTWFNPNKKTVVFFEGIATYFAEQLFIPEMKSAISEAKFDITEMFYTGDSTPSFVKAGGQTFTYPVIEYAIEKYGEDKLQEYFLSPDEEPYDFFGVKKEDFVADWKDWVLKTYVNKMD